jgi:uncharacterized protein (DUF4213/DUF364 family)
MMINPWEIYDLLLDAASSQDHVQDVVIGVTWTLCGLHAGAIQKDSVLEFNSANKIGLAMSPACPTRTLPWSGTLTNRKAAELAAWIKSWDPYQASVGMAAINAVLNSNSGIIQAATPINPNGPGNLSVFEYFLPSIQNKKVVVVGRYPGIDHFQDLLDLTVLERTPDHGDLPDPAAEYVVPEAEWVFLTASSITNKTFPRLAELARDANLVLMGPTVPWLAELAQFGVDFIAGVQIHDPAALRQTVAEGGGTRIFETAIQYRVADLRGEEMQKVKNAIANVVSKREQIKRDMEVWYAGPWRGTFPRVFELQALDNELSSLDTQYKKLWDARKILGELTN